MHPFLTIADRAARLAGQSILRGLTRLDRIRCYEKEPGHIVTEIDHAVEHILIDAIQKAYPHHGILSEERGAVGNPHSDYQWIIDPLDGTRNFIHGFPSFSISIAVKYQSRLEQALIYDPVAQETFYATRGHGARLHQQKLRVSQCPYLKDALLYTHPFGKEQSEWEHWLSILKSLIQKGVRIRQMGSTSLAMAYVAAGRLDGFLSYVSKPWDISAGALLIQEAGGIVCDRQGGEELLEGTTVIGASSLICRNLMKII